jgi:hypothetical protein
MLAASVEVPPPATIGSISAYTSSINGSSTTTKLTISSVGDLTGQQLVYKVFPNTTSVSIPTFKQDISDWSFIPQNGEVGAQSGNVIVIAKRTSLDKLAMGVSAKLDANVWSFSNGGFGGIGGGVIPVIPPSKGTATVNQQPVNAERINDILVAHITAKDIGDADSKEIVIASDDKTLKGFSFQIDKEIRDRAINGQKNITINVPMATMVFTPKMLAGMDQDLEIKISPNSDSTLGAMQEIAASVEGSLLASGQGVAIETNIPEANWNSYVTSRIQIPADVRMEDITALVLRGSDGSWTTVPWKLDIVDNEAYVNVHLTGNGSLSFIRNTRTFDDVGDDFWGKQSISDAASKLFVLGKEAGRFEPESKITRAEYPTLLLRVAGLMNKNADAAFTDVTDQDWFDRSVSIAAQMGIVNGLEDGSYAPQAMLTRVEAMTMVGRMLTVLGISEDINDQEVDRILSAFNDRDSIPEWARKPTALSIKNGIIQGENSRVNPLDALTRAQAAAIAVRLDQWITQQ